MYTTVITHDIYKINTKNNKKFKNLCQHANMNEHVMAETLSGTFNAVFFFWGGGGGNVYNMLLHINAATLRRLTSFILCLI